ncbi:hypothetical protein C7I86_16670 (plasmid) [Synechocystis sp. IPPAS B-1465]|nr:hypothetical protein C7I86_16670 [Synechocystis sp. IPPAS B-1465]
MLQKRLSDDVPQPNDFIRVVSQGCVHFVHHFVPLTTDKVNGFSFDKGDGLMGSITILEVLYFPGALKN